MSTVDETPARQPGGHLGAARYLLDGAKRSGVCPPGWHSLTVPSREVAAVATTHALLGVGERLDEIAAALTRQAGTRTQPGFHVGSRAAAVAVCAASAVAGGAVGTALAVVLGG